MQKTSPITQNKPNIGSLAVDGLLHGLAGGAAMIVVLILLAAVAGEAPAALLGRFARTSSGSPVEGLLSHMAVSGIYGVLFSALALPLLNRAGNAALAARVGGVVYAALLLLAAQTILLPGSGSALLELPFWQWGLAHVVYGLVLGWLSRQKAGTE